MEEESEKKSSESDIKVDQSEEKPKEKSVDLGEEDYEVR